MNPNHHPSGVTRHLPCTTGTRDVTGIAYRFIATIACVTAVGAASACGGAPATTGSPAASQPAAPVTVKTVPVTRGPITRTVTLPTFRMLPYQSATLYAKVAGYVKAIHADKGDTVVEGQVLAELEVPELLADETQFQAEASVAKGNYDRMVEARSKAPDLVVPQMVDDLRGRAEVAQAKLVRTQTLLQFAKITAPFNGVVTARFVDAGAFIPAATTGSTPQGAAILTVMDFSRLRVQLYVPEAEVPHIRNGLAATLAVEELPGHAFHGAITRFSHALDEATKTMLTEIELPNVDGALRPGMYASVRLDVEHKAAALLVPVEALVVDKTGSFVFTAEDGKAHKTPVRTGFNDGVRVEIVNGVPADTPVILVGRQALTDGQAVTAAKP